MEQNMYVLNGYIDRKDYFKSLSEEFGVSLEEVEQLASFLGPNEDFDGLINELDDYTRPY